MHARQDFLRLQAMQEACHAGLNAEQSAECAAEFVLFWFLGMRQDQHYSNAYMRKSAAYFAQNYRRKEARQKRREPSFPDGDPESIPPP